MEMHCGQSLGPYFHERAVSTYIDGNKSDGEFMFFQKLWILT